MAGMASTCRHLKDRLECLELNITDTVESALQSRLKQYGVDLLSTEERISSRGEQIMEQCRRAATRAEEAIARQISEAQRMLGQPETAAGGIQGAQFAALQARVAELATGLGGVERGLAGAEARGTERAAEVARRVGTSLKSELERTVISTMRADMAALRTCQQQGLSRQGGLVAGSPSWHKATAGGAGEDGAGISTWLDHMSTAAPAEGLAAGCPAIGSLMGGGPSPSMMQRSRSVVAGIPEAQAPQQSHFGLVDMLHSNWLEEA